jgi:hypothetical protein
MANEAQIRANRLNALRSTGPRSESGKASAARNGLVHGLRAEKVLARDEDPEAFAALRRELEERFEPAGEVEAALVERMTLFLWRMRRAAALEGAAFEALGAGADPSQAAERLALLARYETGIERGFGRCAELLARAQARRGVVLQTPQQRARATAGAWIDWAMHAPVPGQPSEDELDAEDLAEAAEI